MSRVGDALTMPSIVVAADEFEKLVGLKPVSVVDERRDQSFCVSIDDMLFIDFSYNGLVLRATKRSYCMWYAELACRAETEEELKRAVHHIAYIFLEGVSICKGNGKDRVFSVEKPDGIFGR